MEVDFLVFAGAALAVCFAVVSRRAATRNKLSLEPSKEISEGLPSSSLAKDQSSRFDPQRAEPPKKKRVMTGRAYVTDGDTISINGTQIRLFGVDAPELNHPYGQKAKWTLHGLCKGQLVRAEIAAEDIYGRTVAHCYLPDGRDLSAEMVRLGLAIDWPKFSGGKYRDLEAPDVRNRLFLAAARQQGRMDVWEKFEARQHKR